MDGPDVSLKGSPTVSPTTVALCTSEPLPPLEEQGFYFSPAWRQAQELESQEAYTAAATAYMQAAEQAHAIHEEGEAGHEMPDLERPVFGVSKAVSNLVKVCRSTA